MIERKFKWYHYMMVPFPVQGGIIMAALLLIAIQLFIYEVKEEDIVHFQGECEVTVGPVNEEGKVYRRGVEIQCGDTEDSPNLGGLERVYLYELLTNGSAPAIICIKTISEYLKEVHWTCNLDEDEEVDE